MPMAGRRVMHAAVGMPGTRIPAAADRRITLGDGDRPGEARRAAVRYDRKYRGGHRPRRAEQVDLAFRSLLPPGLSTAETAAKLSVCEATAKTHAGRILGRLGLRDRVRAVVMA